MSMHKFFFLAFCVSALVCIDVAGQNAQRDERPTLDRVAAPIVYEDLVLILASKEQVAAIIFKKEINRGVHFEYRLWDKKSKAEQKGTGVVFEKYKPTEDPKTFVDDGSQLFIKAQTLTVEWSYSMKGRGYIYYY